MPTQILMPALSPTMTEGSLAKWHKKEGDAVKAGDVLAEIETDKATMEFEAVDEGTLGRILVPEGTQHVQVNQPIAVILGEGESAADIKATVAVKPAAAPAPKAEAKPAVAPPPAAPVSKPAPVPQAAAAPTVRADGARVFASPLARRLARNAKLDLANLRGTGPHGRIVKADIEAAVARGDTGAAPGYVAPTFRKERIVAEAGNLTYTEIPLTPIRRVIATRMTESAS
ncbi:MAG: E3 binding domain-containing protein, partial [Alphaproteobacteria bacterium]|nr:E3 binding domain-containing protein [Alphaproteobacteria bacterium]